MQEKLKETKGITLVALIITVIILLILAGVTISLLIGDNGMVTKTKQGVEESEMASIKEQAELVRNEQGINMFRENPQELTKSSYINALNVSFEDSIVEGSRVIVKDKKYAIFVKSNLEVEVIKNDGKTLAEGEMKLDYTVSEEGLIEIYPRIGGVESYKLYAEKILEGKTQEEKEQIFVDGDKYRYSSVYEGIKNPTIEDLMAKRNYSSKEELMKYITFDGEISFDEALIEWQYVKPEGFNFENDKYSEIEIECPNGNKIITDTDTLCVKYQVYKNGEYKFIGNVISGSNKGLSTEVIVPVNLEESVYDSLSLKLKINITDGNKEIQLPVYRYTDKSYTYDCTVNWGDGTTEKVTNENAETTKHTYGNTGEYTLVIEGTYESLYYNSSIQTALKKIEQWGATGLKEIYLGYCTNLEEIAEPSKNSFVNVTDFGWIFLGCSSLTNIPERLFTNCPNVTSFERAFSGCSSLTSIPERLFANCPNVTSFYCTFYECSSLTGKSIQLWNEKTRQAKGITENSRGEGCYYMCEKLEDYSQIPEYWKKAPPQ